MTYILRLVAQELTILADPEPRRSMSVYTSGDDMVSTDETCNPMHASCSLACLIEITRGCLLSYIRVSEWKLKRMALPTVASSRDKDGDAEAIQGSAEGRPLSSPSPWPVWPGEGRSRFWALAGESSDEEEET